MHKTRDGSNTYSDGRTVRIKIRIEPEEESDFSWEHNRFLLGDGAVAEHPRGTICYIAHHDPKRDRVGDDPPQHPSADFEGLRERLLQVITDFRDEADPTESDGEDEI